MLCQLYSLEPKVVRLGDLMGIAKINIKYLYNCQRWHSKGLPLALCHAPLFESTNGISAQRERKWGALGSTLWYAHRLWAQNSLPIIQFENAGGRLIFKSSSCFLLLTRWEGCILQVCVLYFKAKALVVVVKITLKNNHLSTKELQRKYNLSYLSPC